MDKGYCTLDSRDLDSVRPSYVLCHVHFFTVPVTNTDLSSNTLHRRVMLKPLLEKLQSISATYKWGYPFDLIVSKEYSPADVFEVLESL